ncbi:hypothetical protein F5148DRAFT_984714, partial [Russula earlei]
IFYGKITIYPSAIATFYAPSNISGIGGMCCECIHTVKSWRKRHGCYNTIFVNTAPSIEGMQGLDITCVQLFFILSCWCQISLCSHTLVLTCGKFNG